MNYANFCFYEKIYNRVNLQIQNNLFKRSYFSSTTIKISKLELQIGPQPIKDTTTTTTNRTTNKTTAT